MEVGAQTILNNDIILSFGKLAILIILILYGVFSLLIIRQVDLMGKTLITPISKIIRAIAILHSGVIIGLIILAWGIL